MSSSNAAQTELEIVELSNGEIVLRTREGEQSPLVTVRFSSEVRHYLGNAVGDIGKAMIGAGVELVGELNQQAKDEVAEGLTEEGAAPHQTIH